MRVLITGAGGNVGRGLVELLRPSHQLVLHDLNPIQTDLPFFQGDIQIGWNLLPAAAGCDAIIHTPAWHGLHTRTKSEMDFWRLNVDGTVHMFQAAVQLGIKKVVYLSSMAWQDHYHKYGFTKVVGEELCEYYWRSHGIRYLALRPGDFTPWPSWLRYGVRLLYGGVDRRDVLESVRLALENDTVTNDWFPVQSDGVFSAAELETWAADPLAIVERRFPGAAVLIQKYNLDIKARPPLPDVQKTIDALGWRPRFNFAAFLARLAELDRQQAVEAQVCDY